MSLQYAIFVEHMQMQALEGATRRCMLSSVAPAGPQLQQCSCAQDQLEAIARLTALPRDQCLRFMSINSLCIAQLGPAGSSTVQQTSAVVLQQHFGGLLSRSLQ